MNILDILKNAGQKTKKFLSTTPTTLNEQGETVPVEGAQPKLDIGGKIAPLVMAAFALKNPEEGAPMLNSYTASMQNQLEQQKEDAWKQWQVKTNQKRQALEDEHYKIEHPTYTVPTTTDLAKSSPVDYGQYVQNPMTTGITMGGEFKPQDQLQGQINNLGQTDNQIPFLNFGQEAQPQQAPSLSPEAPAAQLRQPSRLDQFAGQTLPLNEALRLQGLDEQAQEKTKVEQEKKAERKAKIDSFSYYENLLPENSPSRAVIADAKKNPDAYNLDFAAKSYLESRSPKTQPVNWKGIGLTKEWETAFGLNPGMATPENLVKAIAAIKDPNEQALAAEKLEGAGLTNDKTRVQIKEIIARTGKLGREGTNKKETAAEKTARLNDIIASAGQYRSYTDYIADLKRNSKAFISDFGSAAYQKAINDAKALPVWQKIITKDSVTGKPKESYNQGIYFKPGQSSPMRQFFPNYVTKEQVKTTVQQQPKGIKIGGKSVTPVVANEIKSVMSGNDMNKFNQLIKKYNLDRNSLVDWYAKNK